MDTLYKLMISVEILCQLIVNILQKFHALQDKPPFSIISLVAEARCRARQMGH